MKNKFGILTISALVTLGLAGNLSSCGKAENGSSSDKASSSKVEECEPLLDYNFDHWNDEEKALMEKWCGCILPYSEDVFGENIKFEEILDSDYEVAYLQITDESNEFSLRDYYEALECAGWNVIVTYNGNVFQEGSTGDDLVELTYSNQDKTVGYDLMYFHTDNNYDYEKDKVYSSNVIRCYADLCATRTTDTSWNAKDLKTIKDVANMELPFINLGSTNAVTKLNYNQMQIVDSCVEDLSEEYSDLLQENGFTLEEKLSRKYDSYILSKTLDDGSVIEIQIYYYAGNGIYVYYTPKMTSYSSWPTDIIAEIKEKSGVEIPKFDIAEGGTYSFFKKNNTYYILTYDLADFDYENYSYFNLRDTALDWNETVSIVVTHFTEEAENEDGDTIDKQIGFQIAVEITTPTSTFTKEWPSAAINNIVSNLLEVDGVTIPSLDSSLIANSGKDIKYSISGKDVYQEYYEYYYEDIKVNYEIYEYYGINEHSTDDEIKALASKLARKKEGIEISVYDIGNLTYNGYCETLEKACWYQTSALSGDIAYEDPTGEIVVVLDSESVEEGKTTISIMPGSGEKHSPELYFEEDEAIVALDGEKQLYIVAKMLPYEITYSSSDATGKITVDDNGLVKVASDAADGLTATITASLTDSDGKTHKATCIITAKKVITYTENSAIESVDALIKEKGYTTTTKYIEEGDIDLPRVTVDFGKLTIAEVEKLVTENFIPEGFELPEDSDGKWTECEIRVNDDDDTLYNGVELEYRIVNEACNISLTFRIYIVDGSTMMFAEAI